MNFISGKTFSMALITGILLAGCGGGSGGTTSSTTTTSNSSAPPVQAPTTVTSGIYDGAINGNQPATTILQADGSYFIVYSDNAVNNRPSGAVVGSGNLNNGSFASSNALDLNLIYDPNLQLLGQGSLSASYMPNQSFNGTLTYSGTKPPLAFTGSYNSAYTVQPSLATIAGTYNGSIATKGLTEDAVRLTIGTDGKLSGQLTCGCNVLTTLTQRPDSSGFIASLVFDGGTHPFSNKSMAGNVYIDVARKRLYIFGRLSNSNELVIYVGTKE